MDFSKFRGFVIWSHEQYKKLQNFRTDIASPIIVTLKQGSFYTVEVSSYQDSNGAKVLF